MMSTVPLFSEYVDKEHKHSIIDPVAIEEIRSTINSLQKYKIPSLDGFPVEFFDAFMDIMELDLLVVVEESRKKVNILVVFNSTFISLIPNQISQYRLMISD